MEEDDLDVDPAALEQIAAALKQPVAVSQAAHIRKYAAYLKSKDPEDMVVSAILRKIDISEPEAVILLKHLKGPAGKPGVDRDQVDQLFIRQYIQRVVNREPKMAVSLELGAVMWSLGFAISAEAGAKRIRAKAPRISFAPSAATAPPSSTE